MAELLFEVVQESDGGYCAECLTENIFTQAETWDELRHNVREAVRIAAPPTIRCESGHDHTPSVRSSSSPLASIPAANCSTSERARTHRANLLR
jgi:hypothetical protein